MLVASAVIAYISRSIGQSVDAAYAERERSEMALRAAQDQFQAILDNASSLIYVKDLDGRFLLANEKLETLFGQAGGELLGKTSHDFLPKEIADAHRANDLEVMKKQQPLSLEEITRQADGEHTFLSIKFPLFSPGSSMYGICGISTDITERKLMEGELRASEEKYRTLFENSNVGMYRSRIDGSGIVDCNEKFAEMYGYTREELIDQPSRVLWADPEARKEVRDILVETGEIASHEAEFLTKDGKIKHVLLSAKLFPESGILEGANVDITDRKLLEEQLHQAQKMESVGRLAGGVAHGLNNMLTATQGYTEMAKSDLPADSKVFTNLEEAQKSSAQAVELTRQLLLFSRHAPMKRRTMELNQTIRNVLPLIERMVNEKYVLTSNLSDDSVSIEADPTNIDQVIINLVLNARDAMPDGGRILIETRLVDVGDDYLETHPDGHSGRYLCLTVKDSGIGIDEETLSRIFEPFFTTKGVGQGTGLGLSVSYGIIEQLGGWIDVESEPGVGSAFRVFIPIADAAAAPEDTSVAPGVGEAGAQDGKRVLLVEDEDAVRNLADKVLRGGGYLTFCARDSKQARSIFEAEGGDFDLIISDVILPGENGVSLAKDLQERKPAIPVLLASGYSEKEIVSEGVADNGFAFIQKPYSVVELLSHVRQLVNC